MEVRQRQFYRDLLRDARATALANAEGSHAVIHSLELIGQQLLGSVGNLWKYRNDLCRLADASPLSAEIPAQWPNYHTPFRQLFDALRRSRNDAVHEGSYARSLTDHAVSLTVILEDALMSDLSIIAQFMVRDVVEAKLWHPVSYVRQQMLKHAFSYLPLRKEETWWLLADFTLARYIRADLSSKEHQTRMAMTVESASLELLKAQTEPPHRPVGEIFQLLGERPILVIDHQRQEVIAGILTASDVL